MCAGSLGLAGTRFRQHQSLVLLHCVPEAFQDADITVLVHSLSASVTILKKKGPVIPIELMAHQALTFGLCKGISSLYRAVPKPISDSSVC